MIRLAFFLEGYEGFLKDRSFTYFKSNPVLSEAVHINSAQQMGLGSKQNLWFISETVESSATLELNQGLVFSFHCLKK